MLLMIYVRKWLLDVMASLENQNILKLTIDYKIKNTFF